MRLGIEHLDLVNFIMRHPANYGTITDDYSPPVEEFSAEQALRNPDAWFLYPSRGVLFILSPHNGVTCEVHNQILPEYRGRNAIRAGKSAIAWVFQNSKIQKIIGFVPEFHKPALLYAKWCGLKVEGVNRKSFLKNGILYDQTMLGICKEDLGWAVEQQ